MNMRFLTREPMTLPVQTIPVPGARADCKEWVTGYAGKYQESRGRTVKSSVATS